MSTNQKIGKEAARFLNEMASLAIPMGLA